MFIIIYNKSSASFQLHRDSLQSQLMEKDDGLTELTGNVADKETQVGINKHSL